MRPDVFRELLRTRPFAPFRVCVSDGASYEVRHPELVVVGPAFLSVGGFTGGLLSPQGELSVLISYIHISRVEFVH